MDYNEAAWDISRAFRRSGDFLKVTLGRDSGKAIRGRDVIVKVDTSMMESRDVFSSITEILRPLKYKVLQGGKVWGSSDKTVWVDGEDSYHFAVEPEKTYTIRVRRWPGLRAATGDLGPIPKEIHKLQDAVSDWEAAIYHATRAVIRAPQFGPLLINMIQGVSTTNDKQLPGLRRQYRTADQAEERDMSTVKQALQRIAADVPESRQYLVPLLRRHASCDCGDDRMAGELDEMFAGRKWDRGQKYAPKNTSPGLGPGKWAPTNRGKGKCFYETGNEKDRCYVTQNSSPPKPSSGSSSDKKEYNKQYVKDRWPDRDKKAGAERLAELRGQRTARSIKGKTAGPLENANKLWEMKAVKYPDDVVFIVDFLTDTGFGKGHGPVDALQRWVGMGQSVPEDIVDSILNEWKRTFKSSNPKVMQAFKKAVALIERTKAARRPDKKARVKSKLDSMGMMNDLRKKHGDGSKAYYAAVLKEVKGGVIAPSAVVGGGLKNTKKHAIEWCQDHMAKAKK
jgi:hypothetical protein